MPTLNKWVNADRDTDMLSAEDCELARENERLRRGIRILKDLHGSGNSPGDCLRAARGTSRKTVTDPSAPVRGSNSLCQAGGDGQMPTAYWWDGPR